MKKKNYVCTLLLILVLCFMSCATASAAGKVSISKTRLSMYIGETRNLKVRNAKTKVRWSSSNSSVARVTSKGYITARRQGTTVITARVSGRRLRCRVTVKSVMDVSRTAIRIQNEGNSIVTFRKKGTVSYYISNSNVISCRWGEWSRNNIPLYITGKKTGTAYITISNSYNNQKKRIRVTVKKRTNASGAGVYQVNMDIFAKETIGGMWRIDTDKNDEYFTDNYNNSYHHSFYAGTGTVTYLTNYKYSIFKGTVACPKGLNYDAWRSSASLYIYGDGSLLASFTNMNCYARPIPFSLNISGYERITLKWVSSDDGNIWRDWGYYATIFDGIFVRK